MIMVRLTRAERRSRTRELLLDAAERVFARSGFHGASLDAIAAEAGYTKGAVYSNFPGKDALFLALLDRRRMRIETQLAAADDGVVGVLAGESEPSPQTEDTWGILTIEFFLYAVRDPDARRALAELYTATRRALAATFESMSAGPRPLALSADDLATVALALSTGIGVQAALDPDAVPPDLYPRVVAGLAGIRPQEPAAGP
jgi:AcrR family transcriptional regulator